MFTERKEGRMELRRGFRIDPGARVLVVEDVVTTGGSAKEAIACLRELGVKPLAVGAIVDRSGGAPFADVGLELFALAKVEVKSYAANDCPLCAAGSLPEKPGSRASAARPGP